jgi:hypothetical protein
MQPADKLHLNNYEVDERASEAEFLLNNPVLSNALDDIYSRAVGMLLEADVGSLTATQAHATMQATMAVRSQLQQYITEKKMRHKYSKGDSHG